MHWQYVVLRMSKKCIRLNASDWASQFCGDSNVYDQSSTRSNGERPEARLRLPHLRSQRRPGHCSRRVSRAGPGCMFVSRHATRRLTRLSSTRLIPASAHLITSQSQKRVESPPFISRGAAHPTFCFCFCFRYRPFATVTMASVESITQSLATLSIQPAAVVNHGETNAETIELDLLG